MSKNNKEKRLTNKILSYNGLVEKVSENHREVCLKFMKNMEKKACEKEILKLINIEPQEETQNPFNNKTKINQNEEVLEEPQTEEKILHSIKILLQNIVSYQKIIYISVKIN